METEMGDARQHFSGEISAALLAELQSLAEKEGRDIQLLIDEAIAAFIEKRKNPRVRDHFRRHFSNSICL